MGLLTTLALAIAAINPAGESEFDTNLNLNLGEKYYIGAAAAGSEGSWYFKPGIAINMVDDVNVSVTLPGIGIVSGVIQFETSTSLSLGFGVHVAENLRLEFGYFESENDIKGSAALVGSTVSLDQETFSIMGLLDFDTNGNWTPYIGVGIVIIDSKLTAAGASSSGSDDTTLCLCAGIDFALSYNVDFSAEYRIATPTFENLDGSNVDIDNGTIFLGFKWIF